MTVYLCVLSFTHTQTEYHLRYLHGENFDDHLYGFVLAILSYHLCDCFFLVFFIAPSNLESCLQSMIGRNMLECQLRRLGVFGGDETISSHPNFDENFKISEYLFMQLFSCTGLID